jgi:hypothetical protein
VPRAAGLEKMGVDRNLPKTGCWVGRRLESAPRSSSSSPEERFGCSFRKVERAPGHQLSTSSISLHKKYTYFLVVKFALLECLKTLRVPLWSFHQNLVLFSEKEGSLPHLKLYLLSEMADSKDLVALNELKPPG